MTFRLHPPLNRTALAVGMAILGTFGPLSSARGQGLITQWTFPTGFDTTNPAPSSGTGTAALVGGTTGTSANGPTGAEPSWNTLSYPAQGTNSGTAGVQFNTATTGAGLTDNVLFRFDQRLSGTASSFYQVQYTTDGTTFTSAGLFDGGFGAGVFQANARAQDVFYTNRTFDLSGIAGVANNANFGVRLVSVFEPNTTAYQANGATSTYGTGGTNRLDNVTFTSANRWIGGTGTDLATAANYAGTSPAAPTASSTLLFNGTTNLSATAGAALSVGQITFGAGAGAYALSGAGAITLTAGVVNQSTAAQTINNDLVMGTGGAEPAQTIWADAAGGSVTLNGALQIGRTSLQNASANAQLFVNGPGNVTINGTITNAGTGAFIGNQIRKTGTGTLLLNSNANAFTGTSGTNQSLVDSGTIGGSGTLPGNLTAVSGTTLLGGQGTAAGQTFTVSGNLTTGSGAASNVTFRNVFGNGAVANDLTTAGASLIAVGGTFNEAGAADTLTFELFNDGSLDLATTYTRRLVTYATAGPNLDLGTFTNAAPGEYNVFGSNFSIASWSLVVGANSIDLTFSPVPEPGTVLGVAALGLGLARVVRRRRSDAPVEVAA